MIYEVRTERARFSPFSQCVLLEKEIVYKSCVFLMNGIVEGEITATF